MTDIYTVKQLNAEDCPKVPSLTGQYEVMVKRPGTPYVGWAIQKTEQLAREKALARLLYCRDFVL